ncbi:MAG: hypothetical protein ACRERS_01300, partial [Methylococcales bacterium]
MIPLIVGVIVEGMYSAIVDRIKLVDLPTHLLSDNKIALYVGIFLAYGVVIGILIGWETHIGLKQIQLDVLADTLTNSQSLFTVGTLSFDEWFDPAVQVYLARILEKKLANTSFRYERILLLCNRSAEKDLRSDYLDGYHAKCLIEIHKALGISLYFIEWLQLLVVLNKLTPEEKVHVGFHPEFV